MRLTPEQRVQELDGAIEACENLLEVASISGPANRMLAGFLFGWLRDEATRDDVVKVGRFALASMRRRRDLANLPKSAANRVEP